MNKQEVNEKVVDVVVEQCGIKKEELTGDTSFVEDLNLDSLDSVELVMEVEDRCKVSIPDAKAEELKTIEQLVAFVFENQREDDE